METDGEEFEGVEQVVEDGYVPEDDDGDGVAAGDDDGVALVVCGIDA